jgi:hypothetical protein
MTTSRDLNSYSYDCKLQSMLIQKHKLKEKLIAALIVMMVLHLFVGLAFMITLGSRLASIVTSLSLVFFIVIFIIIVIPTRANCLICGGRMKKVYGERLGSFQAEYVVCDKCRIKAKTGRDRDNS